MEGPGLSAENRGKMPVNKKQPLPPDSPKATAILRCGLIWVLRATLAAVFLYAGLIKASASGQFLVNLAPYTFLPEHLLEPISLGLPWLEVLLGVSLLIPTTSRTSAALIGLLCLGFIMVIGWALSEDIIVSCSCFGEEDEPPSAHKMQLAILRDVVLGLIAFALAFIPPVSSRHPRGNDGIRS